MCTNVDAARNKKKARPAKASGGTTQTGKGLKCDVKGSASASQHVSRGDSAIRSNNIDMAIACYQKAIKLQPDNESGLLNLGAAHMLLKQYEQAAKVLSRAVDTLRNMQTVQKARVNLGVALSRTGKDSKAIKVLKQYIKEGGTSVNAFKNLAVLLQDRDPEAALAIVKQGLAVDGLHNNDVLIEQRDKLERVSKINLSRVQALLESYDTVDLEEALAQMTQAATVHKTDYAIQYWYARALEASQRAEAVQAFEHAATLTTNSPTRDYLWHYAQALLRQGSHAAWEKAVGELKKAIELYPDFALAHAALGDLHSDIGSLDDALQYYIKSSLIDRRNADVMNSVGRTFMAMHQPGKALKYFQNAVDLAPADVRFHSNLAAVRYTQGELQQAADGYKSALDIVRSGKDSTGLISEEALSASYLHCLYRVSDYKTIKRVLPGVLLSLIQDLTKSLIPSVEPVHAIGYPIPAPLLLELSQARSQKAVHEAVHAGRGTVTKHSRVFSSMSHASRIRLGYISTDFGNHPTSILMQSVPKFHDSASVEVHIFDLAGDDGSRYHRAFRDTSKVVYHDMHSKGFEEVANTIRLVGIDILIDLNVHGDKNRMEILALEPAPVQLAFLGYPGPAGAAFYSHTVADIHVVPPHLADDYFSEKVLFLPSTYQVNDHRQRHRDCVLPEKQFTREQMTLPADKFVFASFNQLYKIDEGTLAVWSRILDDTPNSVLWLLSYPAAGVPNVKHALRSHGIDVEKRVIFTEPLDRHAHIRRAHLADLFLDTRPINAHSTASDTLWAGTPVLSIRGHTFASRVASSLLQAARVPELIVDTPDDYISQAVKLAKSKETLADLRERLVRARDEALGPFDTKTWVTDFERATQALVTLREACGDTDSWPMHVVM